jgi:iron(III) transport system permease protein
VTGTAAGAQRPLTRSLFPLIIGVVLVWFVTAFLVWPNFAAIVAAFAPNGQFSTDAFDKLASSARVQKSLLNSGLLAAALAISTNVVGVFIVLVTSYFRVWGSRVLWLGYATTFIYGGVVLAAGYRAIYGDGGIVTGWLQTFLPAIPSDWFSGFPAVLIAMTLATTTNHMLFVSAAISRIDQQTIEAAQLMGASPWRVLRTVVFPALRPVLFAVTILSFLTGLGALSAPQVLGGTSFQTVAPTILTLSGSPASRDVAVLLALILGLATLALLLVFNRLERGGTYYSLARVSTKLEKQRLSSRPANIALHVAAYALFFIYVLPVLLIVLYSFLPSTAMFSNSIVLSELTLDNYIRVLGGADALRPLIVSVLYSLGAAFISVVGMLFVVRLITRYRSWFTKLMEVLLHIPWVLPSTLAALGLIVAYDHPSALLGGSVLTGTTVILLVAYVVAKIPFTLRLFRAAFASLDQSVEEAAQNLGASPLRILRQVVLPAVFPVAIAVFALNFNTLLDDYDLAVFLANPLYQPLGLAIRANTTGDLNADSTSNNFVYTVLLMVVTGLVMSLVYWRPKRRVRRGTAASTTPTVPALTSGPLS